ncbi:MULTISPECIES: helix-turn-helix transcriptional regulator [unclassified Methanosarcina]|uniref:helix-turn-helix transcriptional regulator n=1 Tax=unclassified Methanosarcina TaxID=2644672 RepID=UPI00210194B6|nr:MULTISPECIES: helix-turn-helix transcriptional regulator [unclassified Methanosarcina]
MKVARAALDMTQKDLAEAVGVTRQTMNAIEKGEYNPTLKLCVSICKVLGKTLDELFWED